MINKKLALSVVGLVLIAFLAGCSKSESEILDEADRQLKEIFLSSETIETNFELTNMHIYKPDSFEFSEERDNNIIFYEDEQPFLLFINEFEEPNSKWYYNELESAQNEDNHVHLKTFESEEEFAYFNVVEREDEEDHYEVQLGIGGIKIATITTLDQLQHDVEEMIKIVKSVEEK
ncbi:hypothetical protein EDC24_0186 [Aquisalibacillus elongatus]|uniref:DUF4367 domain-containing protein n=1 Tax=Aquisalibacillus elongatus TaxID=485577 RepID=A0A3N5C9Q1_9BACI|nr:hypothetical protein EDC24_0186 [Aquisalibacillus elongatus]